MAKDIFVNILDLASVSEVNDGDYLIVETPNGTRIIDFKDLVIPNKNIPLTNTVSENTTAILSANTTITSLGEELNNKITALDNSLSSISADIISGSSAFNDGINTKVSEISAKVLSQDADITTSFNNTLTAVDWRFYIGTAAVSIQAGNKSASFNLTPPPPEGITIKNVSITPANPYAAKNMAFVTSIDPNNYLITITGAFSASNPATEEASYNILAAFKQPISLPI